MGGCLSMHKNIFLIFFLTVLVLSFISETHGGNGRDVFINKCGSCHKSGGEARIFAPTKYASSGWERFFKRNRHKKRKDISAVVTETDIAAVKIFLIDHAADSDEPEAIGLR